MLPISISDMSQLAIRPTVQISELANPVATKPSAAAVVGNNAVMSIFRNPTIKIRPTKGNAATVQILVKAVMVWK